MSGYLARNPLMTDEPQFGPPPVVAGRPVLANALAMPAGDWRDTIAPQPTQADAADATAKAYSDFLARDRQRQIDLGYVDPKTGALTPEGWRAQAQIIGGGFGPADVGAVGIGAIKGYHGSPHAFDRFDMSKIGTGEGNQTFGKGMYIAEREGVARSYRDDVTAAQNQRPVTINTGGPFGPVNILEPGPPKTGHMYEVNLNAEPHEFLHWDKPMSQQSEHVQDAIWGSGIEPTTPYWEHGRSDALGSDYAPQTLEQAQRLAKVGIPGIKYLDRSSRGRDPNAADATHNYAVWTPEIMEIIRRYGIAGLVGGGAAATAAGGNQGQNQ